MAVNIGAMMYASEVGVVPCNSAAPVDQQVACPLSGVVMYSSDVGVVPAYRVVPAGRHAGVTPLPGGRVALFSVAA